MSATPKTYGDRICRRCKGLCSTGAWCTKHKQRNAYWCSFGCLRRDNPWVSLDDESSLFSFGRVDVIQPAGAVGR